VSRGEFLCVFAGVFGDFGFSSWFFCGQDVVNCVANVGSGRGLKRLRVFCMDFRFIFGAEEDGSSFARMPTHAMKPHEWGTQGIGVLGIWSPTNSYCEIQGSFTAFRMTTFHYQARCAAKKSGSRSCRSFGFGPLG
jgi:hypothetical protein